MDHAPFIWSAYGASALILLWTALAPLARQGKLLRTIRQLKHKEVKHDSNA